MPPLVPPPAAPTSSSQGLGTRRSGLLLSHQGPDVPRPCHQIGRVSGDPVSAPQECSFSPKRPGRLAHTLSTCPDSPAGEGRVERLKFHFLRNSRFSSSGCYGRRRSISHCPTQEDSHFSPSMSSLGGDRVDGKKRTLKVPSDRKPRWTWSLLKLAHLSLLCFLLHLSPPTAPSPFLPVMKTQTPNL